ncbi:DbpA RNA binding domain-containing protein [uncultured Muribaculum sp.]
MKPESIGRIIVKDHSALAAVPADEAATLLSRIASEKLKGKRVRTSLLR